MNIYRLVLSNLKRYFKSPVLILPITFMPAILIISVLFACNSSDESIHLPKVAIVCNLNGKYENKLIAELNSSKSAFNLNEEDLALNLLKNNEVSSVLILEDNFSKDIDNIKKPKVQIIKSQDGGGSIWAESTIDAFINNCIKNNIDPNIKSNLITTKIIKKDTLVPADDIITVFMISYCLYVCSAFFSKDLLDLRSANVLRRMLSTHNSDFQIIFSIFLALFLVQSISCLLTLFTLNIILSFKISLSSVLIILANCFVSTGFVMALTRLFKTETGVSLGSVFYSLGSVALCLPLLFNSLKPEFNFFNNLSKLSPMYWTFEALINNNIFLSVLALILLGLIFVTAGSFKLKDFSKN